MGIDNRLQRKGRLHEAMFAGGVVGFYVLVGPGPGPVRAGSGMSQSDQGGSGFYPQPD